jgi:hypothetical protein
VQRGRVADACVLAGGALLVGSAFLPWVRHGPGRSLHGHALVDGVIALGNNGPGSALSHLAVLWYLVPALGALAWIGVGAFGRNAPVTRVVAAAALVVTVGLGIVFARVVGAGNLGAGPAVAVVGAAAFAAGAFARHD